MTMTGKDGPELGPTPSGPWTDRVKYDGAIAFRPNEFIVTGTRARSGIEGYLLRMMPNSMVDFIGLDGSDDPDEWLVRVSNGVGVDVDIVSVTRDLADLGVQVEPNYVLFSHSAQPSCCGACPACTGIAASPVYASPVYASPVYASPVYASPVYASPVYASPVYASPVYASPVYASPVYASEFRASGVRASSARPASEPKLHPIALPDWPRRAIILDTGMAEAVMLPEQLNKAPYVPVDADDLDIADKEDDGFLDPANGHGTFIAGLIELLAPGSGVVSGGVLGTFGDGDIAHITARLYTLINDGLVDKSTVINLSFGGYVMDAKMVALGRAIRRVQEKGAVVVASAGNDGVCQPTYPAAFPDVVSVGAIEAHGRAAYSNHGNWVRACAQGTDVVSCFFRGFNGLMPVPVQPGASDPDNFEGWARWTGTSFAAPVVTAALLRHMALTQQSAQQAVAEIIDAPGLFRYPGLGTVVNLAPTVAAPV